MITTLDFPKLICTKCKQKYNFSVSILATKEEAFHAYKFCRECRENIPYESSKRKD